MPPLEYNPSVGATDNPSAPGDTPLALYWVIPVLAAALSLGLLLTHVFQGGRLDRAGELTAWIIMLCAVIGQTWRHRRWDYQQHCRRLTALESVIKLAVAMSVPEGSEARVIQQMPATMRIMLGMPISIVGLFEGDNQALHIVSSDGIVPPITGQNYSLADLPSTQRCVEERSVVANPNINSPTARVNSALARKLGLGAMLHIPLVCQDRVLGAIVMGDARPRRFTPMDLRRAWLWGCQAAIMVSNCRLYGQMSRSLQSQQQIWSQRDALYAINTAIHRPGTLDEVLQRITNLPPGPLGVDAIVVWLIAEDNPADLVVAAASAPYASVVGYRLPIVGSKGEIPLRDRKVLVIEDGANDPALRPQLRSILPFGSLIFEPLFRSDGLPLGLLVLLRKIPGPVDADQLQLARMFSSRAAAAIETSQLYQQTRRDADAKAILLRELNHRVKNNLASIVSLLSINQPPLRPEARRWLNRAVERISSMARMHELFTGGPQRVTLADLIDQTVRSVSVGKPTGVRVQTDLQCGQATLRTDRAVSLAMAIHELCFNGMVHGLELGTEPGEANARGTLTIRSRRCNGDLILEVEDDAGKGRPAQSPIERAPAVGHTGIGLSLVRGLVGRELRGQFTLEPSAGGALASVQFPLLADELL